MAISREAREERRQICDEYFAKLCEELSKYGYELLGPQMKDPRSWYHWSRCLVPEGTADQVTYHSKPAYSFRIAEEWSWYANTKRCSDPDYIQCESVFALQPRPRKGEGLPSVPIHAVQVCMARPDGRYYCVCGEVYDKRTRTWSWIERPIESVIDDVKAYLNQRELEYAC